MNRDNIISKIQMVFDLVFKENSIQISEETNAKDIETWDSFTHLSLIQEIENAFSIEFSLKELMIMENVGTMISILEKKTI